LLSLQPANIISHQLPLLDSVPNSGYRLKFLHLHLVSTSW